MRICTCNKLTKKGGGHGFSAHLVSDAWFFTHPRFAGDDIIVGAYKG